MINVIDKLPHPFFSVVIPTLNEEKYLPTLLSDLKNQTYKDFEVIIVDAKSVDKTVKKAEYFKDKFLNLTILTSDKKNVSYQRNVGVKNSRSDQIIFLDADVRIPRYFMQGIKFNTEMLKPDILSCWTTPDSRSKSERAATTFINIYEDIQKKTNNPYILESMILITKKAFGSLRGFDENIHNGEGSDLLKRALLKRMKYCFIREPKYQISFRRIRKQGYLNLMRGVVELELKRLINKSIPYEKAERLYPMQGGGYFEIGEKESRRIGNLVKKLMTKTTNYKNNTVIKNNIVQKLKKLLNEHKFNL